MARFVSFVFCCAVLATAVAASADAAVSRAPAQPVPSLTPAKTAKLWQRLVSTRGRHRFATGACSPTRVVFYSPTDWMRLTTRLAATASPCAHYYVSVPPLAADKTQLRTDQAWRIRALGPNFHALAEMSVTGWTGWVAATGNSWRAAGVEARRRLAAAGFDVAAGDTWALNELSTAVRAGTGNARANMRAFLNGLHDGDGAPALRGVVFTAGIGQGTTELSVYQARLQEWYEDGPFWTDLARVTSDWSQEVYGDVRAYAAPGASREARREALNEYLQHQTALAGAAPNEAAAARSLLGAAYAPLANAAWRYDQAFGWTDVPLELMQDYVSAQTDALRAAGTGRFGFAWSPSNLAGLPQAEYTSQTDALLVRLAAAIADSDEEPAAACGTAWCTRTLDGAALTSGWRSFAAWRPSLLAISSPPQELAAGAVSAPVSVELRTATGVPYTAGLAVDVALSTSSPTAELAPAAGGPWSRTLSAAIPSGSSTTSLYVRDSTAGTFALTAAAAGKTAGTQTVVVSAPAPPPPPPPPTPGPPGGGGSDPDLAVTAEAAPAAPAVGSPLSYTVRVRNRGGHASRAVLAVRLPAQVEHLGSEADRGRGCVAAPGAAETTLTCELDYLSGELVATVRIHTVVRRAGSLAFTAASSSEPAAAKTEDDAVTLSTPVAEPTIVAVVPDVAPTLRGGPAARVTRRNGVATVWFRFAVSEPATLQARLTPPGSTRPLTLLRGTRLAAAVAPSPRGAATARIARAGSYVLAARVPSRALVRGRSYAIRLLARDAGGKQRTLVVRVRG